MSLNDQNILGIKVTTSSRESILEHIQKYLFQQGKNGLKSAKNTIKPLVIVTPNPEQMVLAQENTHFADILNQADVALPDGIGVVLAGRFLQKKPIDANVSTVIARIPGVEFMQDLVQMAVNKSATIGLIGGTPGLADKALECLQHANPKLRGWGDDPGMIFSYEVSDTTYIQHIVTKIRATHAQIIFVALGAPKQEYLIDALAKALDGDRCILMAVGGSFDIIAGKLQRAPVFIRTIGFEWLWRLAAEPWRWRRQLALIQFVLLVLKENVRTR